MADGKVNISKKEFKRSWFHKIVSGFVLLAIAVIALLLLSVGFAQTSWFRSIAKNEIIKQVNENINGEFYLKSVSGTFINSLKLNDFGVVVKGDTILSCKEAYLKLSLQALLLKKIFVSEAWLKNPDIKILENAEGKWNLSEVVKSKSTGESFDNAKSSKSVESKKNFPFVFELGDFELINGNFVVKDFTHQKDDSLYKNINYGDIHLTNFNLKINAVGDINKNEFALFLKNLSFNDNLTRFSLRKAKGIFYVNPKLVEVRYLNLTTDSSSVSISTKLKGLNLFDEIVYPDFKNYPVSLSVKFSPFRFSDLSTFVPDVSFLRGKIDAQLKASGKYGDLKIDNLNLKRGYTELNLTGRIKNLDKPSKLFIDATIAKSRIDYDEVLDLFAGLALPEYHDVKLDSLNIHYYGKPDKFNVDFVSKIGKGNFNVKSFLDFTGNEMVYNFSLNGKKLDLLPFINEKTSLNIIAEAKGKGFAPEKMKNSLNLNVFNSQIDGYDISSFNFNSNSGNGVSDISLEGKVNGAKFNAGTHLNLLPGSREYSFSSQIRGLDLSKITFDSTLTSNLNFNVDFSSEALDENNLEGEINVRFNSSVFRGTHALTNTHWQINFWGDSTQKNFDLESELFDASVEGNFNYHELPILIDRQGGRIVNLFINEIQKQFYPDYIPDSTKGIELASDLPDLNLRYDFLIKSSDLPEKILNLKKLQLNGYFKGRIHNDKKKFSFINNTFLEHFVLLDSSQLFFANNFQFETHIQNLNSENKMNNLKFYAKVDADDFYAEREISNPKFLLNLENNNLVFDFSATLDTNYSFVAKGEMDITDTSDIFNFSKLSFTGYDEDWENKVPFGLTASKGIIKIKNFNLTNDSARIKIEGLYNEKGESEISLDAENILLSKAFTSISGSSENEFEGKINLHGNITGKITSPKINGEIICNDFTFRNKNFGDLKFTENYSNAESSLTLFLKDKSGTERLSIKGLLPLPLFDEEKVNGNKLNLKFKADDFDLSALAKFIPSLANQSGNLNSEISVSGDLENPILNGFAKIERSKFKVISTGMSYNFAADFKLKNNLISINKMFIETSNKSNMNGKLNFSGSFLLDHYKFKEFSVYAKGDLPLLDERSKYASPNLYGNLVIGTKEKLQLEYRNDRAFLTGDLVIKQGNITISNENSASSVDVSNIDYVYLVDSSKINQTELLLKNYLAEKFSEKEMQNISGETFFDYDMNLSIENRASLTFIFSKTVNQKLYVITNGSLLISNVGGNQSVQGTFNLLPGSRLEFFRTFDATGFVRFEGDLSNPYFNIEAIYEGNYVSSSATSNDVEKLVAVKIKLDGTLKDLAKKLATDKSNISVYVGKKNIDNNVADPQLSASDAFSFILTGKFSRDLTSNERYQLSSELASAATSMLGSVTAAFLNAQVGDLINDIQVKQSDYQTKITLKGRVGGFYYSVGGSQLVLQDLSTATWRLEYFFNKNLSFRIERREPLTGYFSNTQMTDEIAIKYKVTF